MEDVQACFAAEWDKADGEGNYSYHHETVERGATAAGRTANTSRSKAPAAFGIRLCGRTCGLARSVWW